MENNNVFTDRDVTEHTASMWKYNPVPDSPEPHAEAVCGEISGNAADIFAASVRGKKHKHDGSNRDDSYAFSIFDDWALTSVSDGAGSKIFSRIGSEAACEAAIKYLSIQLSALKNRMPEYMTFLGSPLDSKNFGKACSEIAAILRGSCIEAFTAVENAFEKRKTYPEFIEAAGREPDLKDFSCTLLTAVTAPVETENGTDIFTAAIQIGDGMIAAVDENAPFESALAILGTAYGGNFAGETEFIISDNIRSDESLMARTKVRRGKMSHLLLMTDGVADDYYPNDPQLLRTFIDLRLNGIIPINDADSRESAAKNIPLPAAYPWVNDSDVKYALQYAKNIISANDMTLGQLWDNKALQKKASLAAHGIVHEKERAEMLKVWLDNYVERGSFDDRTLLAVNVKRSLISEESYEQDR